MKKKEVISGIYKITNKANDRVYIGQSYHCLQRKTQHWHELRKNKHSNSHFQNAWNKYGEENFEFEIIEKCSEDERPERERYWIAFYGANITGYNQSSGGETYNGIIYNDERNAKISRALRGRKLPQLSGANAPNAKPVVCVNDGKKYVTVREASQSTGLTESCIFRSCEEHTTTLLNNDIVFMYEKEYNELAKVSKDDIIQEAKNIRKQRKKCNSKEVICLNTGEIFKDCIEASKYVNTDNSWMHACCKNKANSAGVLPNGEKATWSYKKDYDKMTQEEIQDKLQKAKYNRRLERTSPIVCITTGKEFPSIALAAEFYNIPKWRIQDYFKKGTPCKTELSEYPFLEWERK